MSITPGTRIGPYEIVCALGAGGMGEVFRARDTRLGRDVALKILPEVFADGGLNHPGIVAVYDIRFEDGVFYIVTELVEGETLRTLLAEGRPAQRKSIELAVQIAEALAVVGSSIRLVSVDTGETREITSSKVEDLCPRFSPDGTALAFVRRTTTFSSQLYWIPLRRDGKWIYFRSDRGGSREIWKIPASGGSPRQVTHQGGHEAFESPDGQWLYYAKSILADQVFRMPPAVGASLLALFRCRQRAGCAPNAHPRPACERSRRVCRTLRTA